jgi:hypothetical protein
MRIGYLTKWNKQKNMHNQYRHLIFYKFNNHGEMDIKLAVPLILTKSYPVSQRKREMRV